MNSTCRNCGQRGHWKAECPMRDSGSGNGTSSTAPTTTVVTNTVEVDSLPLEFLQLPEEFVPTMETENATQLSIVSSFVSSVQVGYPRVMHVDNIHGEYVKYNQDKGTPEAKPTVAFCD